MPGVQAAPPYARFQQDQGIPGIVINTGQAAGRGDDATRRQRRRQNDALRLMANAILNADPNAARVQNQGNVDPVGQVANNAPPPYGIDNIQVAPPPLPSGAVEVNEVPNEG